MFNDGTDRRGASRFPLKFFDQFDRRIGIENIIERKPLALQLSGVGHTVFLHIGIAIEPSLLMRIFTVAEDLTLTPTLSHQGRGPGRGVAKVSCDR